MPGVDPNFLSLTLGEVLTYGGGGGASLLTAILGGNYILRRRRDNGGNGKPSKADELRIATIEGDVKETKTEVRVMSAKLDTVSEGVAYLRGKADQ